MWHNYGGKNVQNMKDVDSEFYFFMFNNLGGIPNFWGLL